MEEPIEEELLVFRRAPSNQKGVKGAPASPIKTHPITQTLRQNFCHLIPKEIQTECGEPLLKAPNSKLGAFEEVGQSKSKVSPTNILQTSKGKEKKRVYEIERDLFAWLILF